MTRAARLLYVWVVALLLIASLGHAEGSPAVVHADGVDPLRATPVQLEQAQNRFEKGKLLYEEGQYEQALLEFAASRAIVASPNARLYRSRCLARLGRNIEAYSEYGRTMVQALELAKQEVRYQRTAEAATEERAELEGELAFIRINVHRARPETRLFVAGEEIRRQAWGEPIPVEPGAIGIELVTDGYPKQARELRLVAGQSEEVVLDVGETQQAAKPRTQHASVPSPAPPPAVTTEQHSLMPYAYASLGVGVIGLGTFAVLGSMSRETHEALEQRCPDGVCAVAERDAIEQGRQQQFWANVGLAAAGLGLGAAVTLWALDGSSTDGRNEAVGLALHPNGASLWGRM